MSDETQGTTLLPSWLNNITGPAFISGSTVSRQPNLFLSGGFVLTPDPINNRNILTLVPALTGSTEYRAFALPMLSGVVTTTFASGSQQTVGTCFFDPTKVNTAVGTVKYKFRATLAPATTNGSSYVSLYDYNGIVRWPPGPIVGAVLTGSSQGTLTHQSVDLTSILSVVTGSGLLAATAWVDGQGNACTATDVKLQLEWL